MSTMSYENMSLNETVPKINSVLLGDHEVGPLPTFKKKLEICLGLNLPVLVCPERFNVITFRNEVLDLENPFGWTNPLTICCCSKAFRIVINIPKLNFGGLVSNYFFKRAPLFWGEQRAISRSLCSPHIGNKSAFTMKILKLITMCP